MRPTREQLEAWRAGAPMTMTEREALLDTTLELRTVLVEHVVAFEAWRAFVGTELPITAENVARATRFSEEHNRTLQRIRDLGTILGTD